MPPRRTSLNVALDGGGSVTAVSYRAGSNACHAALILAHGAGASQSSPFMVGFARAIAEQGIDTVTFNFAYMEQGRRMPDRGPALEACYRSVISAVLARLESASRFLCIGGKSMGGRIATQVAASDASLPIDGLVLLGYPLHPPGRPERRRDVHLTAVGRPMLFVQGSRDPFGAPAELEPIVAIARPRPEVHVVEGGDHSFKASGRTPEAATTRIQEAIVLWIQHLIAARTQAGARLRD